MYSLTDLNLSENNFTDIGSMLTLGELPCLEIIDFRENAMTKEPLYRIRVLTAFDDRAEQVSQCVCFLDQLPYLTVKSELISVEVHEVIRSNCYSPQHLFILS